MTKLSSSARGNIKNDMFGLANKRKYPMPDRSHAANAKARATQEFNKGNLSASELSQIDRKADAKLKE